MKRLFSTIICILSVSFAALPFVSCGSTPSDDTPDEPKKPSEIIEPSDPTGGDKDDGEEEYPKIIVDLGNVEHSDGPFYTLEQAYVQGLLTHDDLVSISKGAIEFFLITDEDIPPETAKQIKEDYVKKVYDETQRELDIYYVYFHTYFGTYNGSVVTLINYGGYSDDWDPLIKVIDGVEIFELEKFWPRFLVWKKI